MPNLCLERNKASKFKGSENVILLRGTITIIGHEENLQSESKILGLEYKIKYPLNASQISKQN
jgi:hypothetical protein